MTTSTTLPRPTLPKPGLSGALWEAAATLAAPLLRLLLRRRVARGKEIASRLPEREGIETAPRPPGPLLWLHAASVGETLSVLPVLAALPAGLTVLVTTGTVTSAALLAQRLAGLELSTTVLHRFVPLDVPAWGARFLAHWRPDAIAFVESELWPNLVFASARAGIPLLLLNARMSARSFRGWRRLPGLARAMLGCFAHIEAQSEIDAARLRQLGARAVATPGNLKFAAAPLPVATAELERLRALLAGRPVWLAASTHPGEEALVAAVHAQLAPLYPGLLTIVAPRHPDRGADIAASFGDPAPRRALGQDPPAAGGFWVADTLGELGLLYRLSPLAFVGGSTVPRGGQNPLEPARLGCAVAMGRFTDNHADAVAALSAAGALVAIDGAEQLAAWVAAMLDDPAACARIGEAGQSVAGGHDDLPRAVASRLVAAVGA
jgi:3-deoxy-D-manno-octulosonic-acid transferase